jgi:hypothetical protein
MPTIVTAQEAEKRADRVTPVQEALSSNPSTAKGRNKGRKEGEKGGKSN